MQPTGRLLAVTDLSAPARHAAERAALVASELGAGLDLLHVISLSPVDRLRLLLDEEPADFEAALLQDARAEMARLAAHLRSYRKVEVTEGVASGGLIREINHHAAGPAVRLLVLGARGASFMRHALLGSTAERLVRKSVRPLLVVRQPPHEPYRKVLVAVDFSASSLPALALARAIAPSAELVVLHAYSVPFEERLRAAGVRQETLDVYRAIARRQGQRSMDSLLATVGLAPPAVTPLLLEGDPCTRLLEQEQEQDCDLVVVGKQGESPLEEALIGSVTKHVLQESQGDVLVSVAAALQPDAPG